MATVATCNTLLQGTDMRTLCVLVTFLALCPNLVSAPIRPPSRLTEVMVVGHWEIRLMPENVKDQVIGYEFMSDGTFTSDWAYSGIWWVTDTGIELIEYWVNGSGKRCPELGRKYTYAVSPVTFDGTRVAAYGTCKVEIRKAE